MILTTRTAQVNPFTSPDQISHSRWRALGGPEHVLVAALLVDELAVRVAGQVRAQHFQNPVLHDAAAVLFGSISTDGICDVEKMVRLLRQRHRPERIEIDLAVVDRIRAFIVESDVQAALAEIAATPNGAAA